VKAGAAEEQVLKAFAAAGVPAAVIGSVTATPRISIACNGSEHINAGTAALRDQWEATSFELERLQSAAETVAQEQAGLSTRSAPHWELTYTPTPTPLSVMEATNKPKVSSSVSSPPSCKRP
jgi:phosphoribosylformylglycinamidine synthase